MIRARRLSPWQAWLALLILVGLWLATVWRPDQAARAARGAIAGRVVDSQGEPVGDVAITLQADSWSEPADETITQADGSYVLTLPDGEPVDGLAIRYQRAHFRELTWNASPRDLNDLLNHGGLVLPDTVLEREYRVAFWIGTLIFVGMLVIIALEGLHNTLAALLGIALVFTISAVGGAITPDLFILTFEQALYHVNFEVIFLLLGMMIVIGVIEGTGIFQWLAYRAYRLSSGRGWLLAVLLMLVTAGVSSLLDNVIAMLLIAPITLQIALALDIDPRALLIPEVLASNTGGVATLVGTPTNILIGSYAGLSFNDFLTYLTPGVLMALVALMAYALVWYRREYRRSRERLSPALLARLEANARITDPIKLRKAGIVFSGLLLLFIFGEALHLTPAVSAIVGAVVMLIWVHPDIEQMMTVVDWTTLMFFIGLFMMVGVVQEVGLIALVAGALGGVVGDSVVIGVLVVALAATIGSGLVENIPFAAAMLPVVRHLSRLLPASQSPVLYYALAIGAGMGGSSTLIGASPNLVTAGIARNAGYSIRFGAFLRVGLPATLITVALSVLWLLIRFGGGG